MQASFKAHYKCILRFPPLRKQYLTNNLTNGEVQMCQLTSNAMVLLYKAQQVERQLKNGAHFRAKEACPPNAV